MYLLALVVFCVSFVVGTLVVVGAAYYVAWPYNWEYLPLYLLIVIYTLIYGLVPAVGSILLYRGLGLRDLPDQLDGVESKIKILLQAHKDKFCPLIKFYYR